MRLENRSKKTFFVALAACLTLAVGLLVTYLSGSSVQSSQQKMPYLMGVNLAGAEFGPGIKEGGPKGTFGTEYTYPIADLTPGYNSPAYFLDKGMNVFRLPIKWERLQHNLGKPLDKDELARLTLTVTKLRELGAWVILDLHNFGRYEETLIGTQKVPLSAFADFWSRLAKQFNNTPRVVFGLMNEPYDIESKVWVSGVNLAVSAIRKTNARNLIFVGGINYSSTMNWYENGNSEALLDVKDPFERIIFEGHLYFDVGSAGQNSRCISDMIGVQRVKPFLRWLKENSKVGFIGEFGAGRNPRCARAISNLVKLLGQNRDKILGWTYWAAGPWWPEGNIMSIEPEDGWDAPQLTALIPHIVSATGPSIPAGVAK